MAVAGRKCLERRDVRMPRPEPTRERAGDEVGRESVLEDRELAVEHRDVDHRAGPGLAPLVERAGDARREEERRRDVADRHADARGRAVGMAGQAHDPTHRLRDEVERGAIAKGPGMPEARRDGVDERRPARVQRRPSVAEALEDARPEVLDENVGLIEQLFEHRPDRRPSSSRAQSTPCRS
jgi:hypothetical protein